MKAKRALLWSSLACLVLGAALSGYLYFFVDEPPHADEDLRPAPEEVPEAENGFHVLRLAEGDIDLPLDRQEEYDPFAERWDLGLAREILDRNAPVLQAFAVSRAQPRFKVPEPSHPGERIELLPWRQLAQLLGMRVRVLFEDGKEKEAFEEAMELLRFSRRVESSEGGLVHYLIGLAIRREACRHLRRLIERSTLPEPAVRSWVARLEEFKSRRTDFLQVVRINYRRWAELFDRWGKGDRTLADEMGISSMPGLQALFKPNQTKRLFAESQRELILKVQGLPAGRACLRPEDNLPEPWPAWYSWRNRLGLYVLQTLRYVPKRCLSRVAEADLSLTATRTLFALKCYREMHGRLPASLRDLVPGYLKEVPLDPFDGNPLRYSQERRFLYSVGDDLQDQGGFRTEDEADAEEDSSEPTFRVDA